MTIRVVLTRWNHGLRKVELTKEFRDLPVVQGLAAAKAMTDALLGGESVQVSFDDADEAESFLQRVKALGADGYVGRG